MTDVILDVEMFVFHPVRMVKCKRDLENLAVEHPGLFEPLVERGDHFLEA